MAATRILLFLIFAVIMVAQVEKISAGSTSLHDILSTFCVRVYFLLSLDALSSTKHMTEDIIM